MSLRNKAWLECNDSGIVKNRLVRFLLMIAGTFFTGLGLVGAVLPLLPTTPFLLLAAACYSKSSKRFHCWLLTNRVFGSYIRGYIEGKGIPLKMKAATIIMLWTTISISALIFMRALWIQGLLFIIAIVVTLHIASIKTRVSD